MLFLDFDGSRVGGMFADELRHRGFTDGFQGQADRPMMH